MRDMSSQPHTAHANPLRQRLHIIIFEADTPAGKAFDEIRERFVDADQAQVFRYWESLDPAARDRSANGPSSSAGASSSTSR